MKRLAKILKFLIVTGFLGALGGAIALGPPIGMSGNRLALTLLHELKRRGGGTGCPR